jgi:hypothetical protein
MAEDQTTETSDRKVLVTEKYSDGMTISLVQEKRKKLENYWSETEFILDKLPENGERIKMDNFCTTILIKKLQRDFSYVFPKERLDQIKVVDVHKMLSKFNVVNPGTEYTLQEGNGAYIHGGFSGIIIQDRDKLCTISIISMDLEEEHCFMDIRRNDRTYETSYRKTFDPTIREKTEYKWRDIDGKRQFKLERILVDSDDIEISDKRKHKYRNLAKRFYKRNLGSWYVATGLSDTDSDNEENPTGNKIEPVPIPSYFE